MKIEKKAKKTLPPVSFRIPEDSRDALAALSEVTKKSQAGLLKEWIAQAYDEAKRKWPNDLRKAEKQVREDKK